MNISNLFIFKKIDIKVISVWLVLFVLLQSFFSFQSTQSFLSRFGLLQLVSLFFFSTFFALAKKIKPKQVFLLIFVYQLTLVLFLFTFYVLAYGNPLGFEPKDAVYYNLLGLELQNKNLYSSIVYLLENRRVGDLGFPILLKFIYSLGGNKILNVKIFNILFHLLTCFYLYKISIYINLKKYICKNILILYGLNPISIYFNASGLKEPFLLLMVTLSFYFFYKAYTKKLIGYYFVSFLTLLMTGLFRAPFPVLIFFSLGSLLFIEIKGRYRYIFRIFILLIVPLLLVPILWVVKDELIAKIAINRSIAVTNRIGIQAGFFEYSIMAVSGIIGPFPTFAYGIENDNYLLQTVGNFIKLVLSYFFLIGCVQIFKNKLRKFYPLLIFIASNIAMLTFAAATLDHRLLYPFIPFYFLIIGYGYSLEQYYGFYLRRYMVYIVFIIILVIGYNLR
ncbi:hypothetical protein SAMN05443144_14513 [Fodinibius roseus]|uniref:Dolichyl-phosphate-mannose-protein mannosyltransferase n=1 Tax=Fodinibius roseus TaxID=1194090 RepID=A0A1M5LUG2_9BACT|nr:hypothetical protein [Fodinibius roseus]SHG68635.1 hypothetical protein SAMN05443144_14513 [Fodinibius roseus]